MLTSTKVVDSEKIWACLVTNESYLRGLLTLAFSLRRVHSRYPLVALYTASLDDATRGAMSARGIPTQRVPYLRPSPPRPRPVVAGAYDHDPRFRDAFTKLAAWSLTGYSRVVLLDADMLVLRNMDELMDLPLDEDRRLFAATHACLCNPCRFPHYPRNGTPSNCAYTTQHSTPDLAQTTAPPSTSGLGLLNSGTLVLTPSLHVFSHITAFLHSGEATPERLPFPDQDLLALLFPGRWAPLPYVYNALKTMRWHGVHSAIWRDGEVKCVYYILTPKPWEQAKEKRERKGDGLDRWWWEVDLERRRWEGERGMLPEWWEGGRGMKV
ncbi:glycosyl transferase [Achaetomium macrosporum]|uniref:Glycosyl transferase n=1 Tax=Achaetomium macrosporum TaxID=79813 RepID=A0AAN7C339_9PEZI|nr:glycosyl transferase [Achaetomium macrosporum]